MGLCRVSVTPGLLLNPEVRAAAGPGSMSKPCTRCLPGPRAPCTTERAQCEGSPRSGIFCLSAQVIMARLHCDNKNWNGRSFPWANSVAQCCPHCHLPTPSTSSSLWWLFLLTGLHLNRRPVRPNPEMGAMRKHTLAVPGVSSSVREGAVIILQSKLLMKEPQGKCFHLPESSPHRGFLPL